MTAAELFRQQFRSEPRVVASAPGRVNLIGEHTDYNGGDVLPIAIAQRTTVAVAPANESVAVSAQQPLLGRFSVAHLARERRWWDYVAGVAAAFIDSGYEIPDFQIAVASDVPVGAGLSSSAALETATAFALARLFGHDIPPQRLALLGTRAEREFVGVASGIMDQQASALGAAHQAVHIRCDTGAFEHVPFDDAVLIFDTGVRRALADSAFNDRRAECQAALTRLRLIRPSLPSLAAADLDLLHEAHLPPPLDRRARHVVTEMSRVRAVVDALRVGGTLPGEALFASHESLRVDYECSSPELDAFVDRARHTDGITGARLTGAGWGGCAIAVGNPQALATLGDGWITHAAAGARIEHG
ncbi:MAG TPA: galactokinase [Gemmatimonadaceae bacterium]|nr:galactokinase [Gemmatimonadaceae bacterium]